MKMKVPIKLKHYLRVASILLFLYFLYLNFNSPSSAFELPPNTKSFLPPPPSSSSNSRNDLLEEVTALADSSLLALKTCDSKLKLAKEKVSNCAIAAENTATSSSKQTIKQHSKEEKEKWLTIGIPTVSREENHLETTLSSLLDQLPSNLHDPLYQKVLIIVMNMQNDNQEHVWFDLAKSKYSHPHPKAGYIVFTTDSSPPADPSPGQTDAGNANFPGYRVRKQTRNIVSLMKYSEVLTKSEFFMFSEDDMEMCDHGIMATQYMLNKAENYFSGFMMIRASYGMNGIFIRSSDLGSFGDYLLKHQSRRPPDHLVVEWFAGETDESSKLKKGRAHLAFRYNILDHMGVTSTLRKQKSQTFPACFEELGEPTLFNVEAFDFKACADDDIWPCDVGEEVKKGVVEWGRLFCTGGICTRALQEKFRGRGGRLL